MSGPFHGVKLLDCSTTAEGAYASGILADYGANVLRILPPSGDPLCQRRGYPYWNRGKRCLTLDLQEAPDITRLQQLARNVDIVLLDTGGAGQVLDLTALLAEDVRLIGCQIAAFADHEPSRHLPHDTDLAQALAGMMAQQIGFREGPIFITVPFALNGTALSAALGIAAALYRRERTGRGGLVETSLLRGTQLMQPRALVRVERQPGAAVRFSSPFGLRPAYRVYQCRDRWMLVGCLNHAFYRRFLAAIGHPELLDDPRFGGRRFESLADAQELDLLLEQTIRQRPLAEWLAILEAVDVPAAPVCSADEFAETPQVKAMEALTLLPWSPWGPVRLPGLAVHFSETPGSAGSGLAPGDSQATPPPLPPPVPPPPSDSSPLPSDFRLPTSDSPPLSGLRILDCSSYIAGPYQSAVLADLGAEVVKLESPSGDQFRDSFDNFISVNRGKRSIALDLKAPDAYQAALALARQADVLVENLRPGAMERLGLGYDRLRQENPRLVYSSLTGFGPIGPDRDKPGMDPILQARAGMMALQGGDGNPPIFMQVGVCDMAGAMLSTLGILGALFVRERSGTGQKVEVSLLEATIAFLHESYIAGPDLPPAPAARPDHLGRSPFRRLYQASDGWLLLAADEEPYRARLGSLLADKRPSLGEEELEGAIEAMFQARSLLDCLEQLHQAGIPACRVPTYRQINDGPEVDRQRVRTRFEHPQYGETYVPGGLIVLDGTAHATRRRAPLLGEHTAEVLAELGLGAPEGG